MFKQRDGSTPFGNEQASEQAMPRPLSIQVPDVHESMRLAGVKDLRLEQNGQSRADKRARLLCCCGSPGCGIGPMTQVVEER